MFANKEKADVDLLETYLSSSLIMISVSVSTWFPAPNEDPLVVPFILNTTIKAWRIDFFQLKTMKSCFKHPGCRRTLSISG